MIYIYIFIFNTFKKTKCLFVVWKTTSHISAVKNHYIIQNILQVDTESSSAEMSVNELSHNTRSTQTFREQNY